MALGAFRQVKRLADGIVSPTIKDIKAGELYRDVDRSTSSGPVPPKGEDVATAFRGGC